MVACFQRIENILDTFLTLYFLLSSALYALFHSDRHGHRVWFSRGEVAG